MPIYDFTCEICSRTFEQFLSLEEHSRLGATVACEDETCGGRAEQVILPRRNRARYAYLPAITYYENPETKEVMHAASPDGIPPPGFIKKRAEMLNEQRALGKKLNHQDYLRYSEAHALEQRFLHDQTSQQHSELRNQMQGWNDVYKDMARIAMEEANRGGGAWDKSGAGRDYGYFEVLE